MAEGPQPDAGASGPPPAGAGALLGEARGFPSPQGPMDLAVRRGEVVLLRGGNGAGKTSLLRSLAGLPAPLRPAEARLAGADPAALPANDLAARVRAVWSTPGATLVGLTLEGEARLRRRPLPPGLSAWRDRVVATLSPGEARQAELAFLAASPAPLVLLDEPCTALDEAGRRRLAEVVAAARREGAVVVADHTGWATPLADRAVDLGGHAHAGWHPVPTSSGPVVVEAPPATVRRGPRDVALPSVRLPAGLHAVVGPNGAGKTTLLRRLAGLGGSAGVQVAGAPPRPGASTRMQMADAAQLFLRATVADELASARAAAGGRRAEDGGALGLVPDGLHTRHPLSLSAGEAQRLALAKALAADAGVAAVLLDEPEAHLDAGGRAALQKAIAARVAAGACVVAATHDAGLAAAAATRTEVGA